MKLGLCMSSLVHGYLLFQFNFFFVSLEGGLFGHTKGESLLSVC